MESGEEALSLETVVIVACVCGSIVLVLTVVLIVLCCRRHRIKCQYSISCCTDRTDFLSKSKLAKVYFASLLVRCASCFFITLLHCMHGTFAVPLHVSPGPHHRRLLIGPAQSLAPVNKHIYCASLHGFSSIQYFMNLYFF